MDLVRLVGILQLVSDQDDRALALPHEVVLDAFLEEVAANVHVQSRQGIILREYKMLVRGSPLWKSRKKTTRTAQRGTHLFSERR